MMRKVVDTVIGGCVGLLALYVVSCVSYEAGHRMAEAECRYERIKKAERAERPAMEGEAPKTAPEPVELPKTARKSGRFVLLSKIGKAVGGSSTIGRILKNPDEQHIEMYVDGDTFRIDVTPKQ